MSSAATSLEHCGICSAPLVYEERAQSLTCTVCGVEEMGHVHCPDGHYICERCHGANVRGLLLAHIATSRTTSPQALADELLVQPGLPMLGCEHALIAAGALMAALRNRGEHGVTDEHVQEALLRTERQAISAYCGLSGVCGVVPALGSCYSVLVGAQCGKGPETRATMELVSTLAAATASEADPGCCKAFVRTGLRVAEDFLAERLGIAVGGDHVSICEDAHRHPHGCRGPECTYHPDQPEQTTIAMSASPEATGVGAPFKAEAVVEASDCG